MRPIFDNSMVPQQNFNMAPQHFPESVNPQFSVGPMSFPAQPNMQQAGNFNMQPAPAYNQPAPSPYYNPAAPAVMQQPVSDACQSMCDHSGATLLVLTLV